ncbi:MAG: hypothetical protein Rubg2KO_26790 [Rubricoccaceae bacterium]
MRRLLLLPLLVALGCGSDASPTTTSEASGTSAASTEASVSETIGDNPCDLLPASLVASALGVSEADLDGPQRAADVGLPASMDFCKYEAGDAYATINQIQVSESADAAATAFASMYRTMTTDEAAQASTAMDEALNGMREDGEVDDDIADAAQEATGDVAAMGMDQRYEPVDGLGDQAVQSIFRDYPGGVLVRKGALIFGIDANTTEPPTIEENLVVSRTVAEGVLAGL